MLTDKQIEVHYGNFVEKFLHYLNEYLNFVIIWVE